MTGNAAVSRCINKINIKTTFINWTSCSTVCFLFFFFNGQFIIVDLET